MDKRVFKIGLALLASLIAYFASSIYLDYTYSILIAIVVLMISLWTNEVLSLGIVSVFPLFLFPIFRVISFEQTVQNYFNPILLLFIGGMLIALAIEKSYLHEFISSKIISIFPKTPRGIVFSLAITSAILSAILSNTTVVLMLLPVALFVADSIKLRVRTLLATAYGASIGGILTPIGTPPNIILLGFMKNFGLEGIGFVKWIILLSPLVIVMLIVVPFMLSYGLKNEKIKRIKSKKLNWNQKKLLLIVLALIAVLLANSPIEPYYGGLGLSENIILFSFGILMFLPGFRYLKAEDLVRLPLNILLLFGAGFAIASAMLNTGLVELISNGLVGFADLPSIVVILIIAFTAVVLTELTSNTALASIFIPTVYGLALKTGLEIPLFLLIPTIAASMGFMLPIATPPNAIIFSSKAIKIKDMIKFGFITNLISIALITLFAYLYWSILI